MSVVTSPPVRSTSHTPGASVGQWRSESPGAIAGWVSAGGTARHAWRCRSSSSAHAVPGPGRLCVRPLAVAIASSAAKTLARLHASLPGTPHSVPRRARVEPGTLYFSVVTPSDDVTRPQADDVLDASLEPRVGSYRLVRELGQGGMGTVYLAVRDDDAFHKRVALKILKRGMDTDAIVRRFRTERQILAGLDHPNIARLLDGGTTPDGRPYLVMEYVDGAPLGRVRRQPPARHHRAPRALPAGLRPPCSTRTRTWSSTATSSRPTCWSRSDGVPKLLDFGIAKLLNPEMAGQTLAPTAAGLQLMTPEYASPEQVRGETVTTATDVYSLGGAALRAAHRAGARTGSPAARSPTSPAWCAESEPLRPSVAVGAARDTGRRRRPTTRPRPGPDRARADTQRLRRRLAGDLDNIVLKALSKEPVRRYASVDQFAEDVRRHLAGLPVLARHDTLGYRASKFVRRHRGAVDGGGGGRSWRWSPALVGIAWQARVARRRAGARRAALRRRPRRWPTPSSSTSTTPSGIWPARRRRAS